MGWFQHLSKFLPNTFIKSDPMNDKLDRIAASFDYLPTPRESGEKGFLDPLAVGGATKPEHATTAGQSVNKVFNTGIDAGTANNYDITIPIAITSYTDGLEIWFKPANNCTGASQVNVNGLGNVPLKKANGQDLSSDDMTTSSYSGFRFNGTEFRAIGTLPGDADQYVLSRQYADESKRWAIGDPTEPAEHSAKWWAESVNGLSYMRRDIAAQGGIGADVASDTVDWNSVDAAKAGCSHYLLNYSAPNGPPAGAGYFYPFTFEYSTKDGSGNMTQLAIGYNTSKIMMRYRYNGIWHGWHSILTDESYGDWNLGSGAMLHSNGINIAGISSGNIYFGESGTVSRFSASEFYFFVTDGVYSPGLRLIPYNPGNNMASLTAHGDNLVNLGIPGNAWRRVESYAYNTASDERLKDISYIGDTSWVYNLKPIAYTWKDGSSGIRYGFGAQTTYNIMPDKEADLVQKPEKDNEPWGMQLDQLIPLLLNEMKVLRKRIEKLEGK